ncbi:hypothetical protein ACLGL1_05360 [Peptococcus simiae]|uniref:hypothetical protein n=1 Tax=Peptococcus simiae TaxID=1643805 RepID=UPI00397F3E7C
MKRNILVITVLGLLLCVVGAIMTVVQLAETEYVSEEEYRQALGYETMEKTFTLDPAKGPVVISDRLMDQCYLVVDNRLKDNQVYVNACYLPGKGGQPLFEVNDSNRLDLVQEGGLVFTDETSPRDVKDLLFKAGQLYKDQRIIGSFNEGTRVVVNQKNFDRINEAYYGSAEVYEDDGLDDDGEQAVVNA